MINNPIVVTHFPSLPFPPLPFSRYKEASAKPLSLSPTRFFYVNLVLTLESLNESTLNPSFSLPEGHWLINGKNPEMDN